MPIKLHGKNYIVGMDCRHQFDGIFIALPEIDQHLCDCICFDFMDDLFCKNKNMQRKYIL